MPVSLTTVGHTCILIGTSTFVDQQEIVAEMAERALDFSEDPVFLTVQPENQGKGPESRLWASQFNPSAFNPFQFTERRTFLPSSRYRKAEPYSYILQVALDEQPSGTRSNCSRHAVSSMK